MTRNQRRQPGRYSDMALLGQFERIDEDEDEDFESYVERFEHYVRAVKVSDDLKVSTFVTAMGKKTYRTLKNLLAPAKPEEKEYSQLVTVLKEHYAPKRMVIAERFRFNRRSQHEGESVAAFAVELKRLASSCEFRPFREEALRDRFVAGLKDQPTQAELLKKSTLTFATACDIAKSVELARAETRKFQPATRQPEEVHDVRHTYRAKPAARASAKPAAAADGAEHPIETPDFPLRWIIPRRKVLPVPEIQVPSMQADGSSVEGLQGCLIARGAGRGRRP